MQANNLIAVIENTLENHKAIDVQVLPVKEFTSITDYMIIATGSSTQHIRTLANKLQEEARKHHFKLIGVEGERHAEWILLDFGDAVVHLMQHEVREYYALEKLWCVETESACAFA